MRFEGILSAWDAEAGHGRIRALHGGDEVFVGLAAFPTDGEGARLDERLSFEIAVDRGGRKQAVNLQRIAGRSPALGEAAGARLRTSRQAQKKRRLALAAGAVVAVVLVIGGVRWWQPQAAEPTKVLR